MGKKGWLHTHEIADLLKAAIPSSVAPERFTMVLQSYNPPYGVTWAGGGVTLEVRRKRVQQRRLLPGCCVMQRLCNTCGRHRPCNHAAS